MRNGGAPRQNEERRGVCIWLTTIRLQLSGICRGAADDLNLNLNLGLGLVLLPPIRHILRVMLK